MKRNYLRTSFDREKYRHTVFRETLMFSLTIYDHVWPCTSSGLMSLILGFIKFHVLRAGLYHLYGNFAIHMERSKLRLGRAMKEDNDDHLWPFITMYFEQLYPVYVGLYKFLCSSSGVIPFIFSFLNFSFILRSEFHLRWAMSLTRWRSYQMIAHRGWSCAF